MSDNRNQNINYGSINQGRDGYDNQPMFYHRDEDMNLNRGGIPMGTGLSENEHAQNNIKNMSQQRLRKVMTQYLQSKQDAEINQEGQMGQLDDRKASDSFQG